MNRLFFIAAFWLIQLYTTKSSAQELRFNQVLKNFNGGVVGDMVQDKQGFLWLATRGQGLKRYDGINFKTYTYDGKGVLWIGCLPLSNDPKEGGLNRFDRKTGKFIRYGSGIPQKY